MDQQATDFIVATRSALSQASALAVQYSFSIVGAMLLLLVGWALSVLVRRWAHNGLLQVRGIDETLARFFANFIRYAVLLLVFIAVLGQFGVQTASIIAALGAAGLAIGLALQGTLQNIAAGIMLLVLRPFRVGEYIETGNISGTIQEVGLFATELRTPDGLYRLAPNSTLWNVPITNFSRESTRRFALTIGIGYEDDIDIAQNLMRELAERDPRVLADPPVSTFVSELADSAVVLTMWYWTSAADFWPTSRDMIKAAKLAFDENGISIPFPQVTYNSSAPLITSPPEKAKREKA
ncbi:MULTISPECIES: mechanosensitive ion channel family protein [Alphaproteobacteria]|uniref:Small-conductance mechanosensitive channel n=2 Tax=Alphaproteobacteria TaxID=28211 RepID=A0A512HGB0_9HYPH|nr:MULTISPECIES: mechanosensitive ion channel domain-containing protein [Alphaproteobacteria]GEO84494.1 mechanosensitive ion channel protein [Ciceribacter naphthalenivorans]GLR22457.1 mechanosensitive ion channel protein [Ciceribacter naphthalenivorans]GLT05313.1 mechanosensitive ion channel protein [Sphingomonas psychrolutea]